MTIRTSKKTVTFRKPFFLSGIDEVLPAGTYDVETDEELLEGISFPAYRRVLTLIRVHPKPGLTQTMQIDSNELDAALKRDQALADIVGGASENTLKSTTDSHEEDADRQAVERGEDEGMMIHPG